MMGVDLGVICGRKEIPKYKKRRDSLYEVMIASLSVHPIPLALSSPHSRSSSPPKITRTNTLPLLPPKPKPPILHLSLIHL